MGTFQLHWDIKKEHHGWLLREFLREHHISKSALTDIKFNGGKIVVNGNEKNVRYVLQEGDQVTVHFPEEKRSQSLIPENIPLDIVYEDDYCLIVNKPAFLSTIPSREHPSGSLANGLLHYYDQQRQNLTVHIVNRLDRDTSGLLLVAKHRYSHFLFSKEQQKGAVKRTYIAIVHGRISEDEGTIDAPIARKDDSIIERTVREDGKKAITHFRVISRFSDKTVVEVKPVTGRTHQIRLHMSYIGHPLLGDSLYGGQKEEIDRHALHSQSLSFYHPVLHKNLTYTCKLPPDMEKIIKHARL
ncbi:MULTISPECIES: RluA family pseudouridine synthase [unclassified Aeribacillus]|jgi:23S rRNA pseudouridine1911/1915/1917 synthase|uniref:RluA family pseudouridine synthase n=1 Tax=unclassified Aeribacillus TaxID=2640495 RepID=UPI0028715684|nr:RluA family pseudouridine synthase [Aeribacillus pallidus]